MLLAEDDLCIRGMSWNKNLLYSRNKNFLAESSYFADKNADPKVVILSHGSAYHDDNGGGFTPLYCDQTLQIHV